ncbi:MAG TPA: type IV secretion system protein [Steroidobacteraceae bacterium]|jgi:type IV secretion system protein VirB5|nr:type IV secretion system protein [Steroidobacteraceae bacterium]
MRRFKVQVQLARVAAACLIACAAGAPAAHAQWAVIDAPAIVQLMQEVQTTAQQLATARQQLLQAQQALETMTGDRGMEQLLSGTVRNYLPSDWTQVTGALQGSGGFGALSADMQGVMAANAVLSPQRLATLSPAAQQLIQSQRQWSAMRQALAHQALANASGRFAAIQSLIAAISTATDQKAALDLQARISAELGMLQNEHSKVQILNQSAEAQESSLRQQAREQVLDGHGRFDARFQPVP